jgi:hypothetical protein
MLGQLLLQRSLDHPAGDLAEHAILPEDLALASLPGDQLVDHPVEQPLAQLLRQLVAPGAQLIQQRVDQRLTRIVGHSRHRSSQPGLRQRPLDHLRAQGPSRSRAPQRGRRTDQSKLAGMGSSFLVLKAWGSIRSCLTQTL